MGAPSPSTLLIRELTLLHKVDFRNRIFEGPAPRASRELEEHGWTMLRALFSQEEVEALRAEIVDVYDRCPSEERAGSESPAKAAMFRYAMYNKSPLCQRALAHRGLLDVIEPLLGDDCHVIANTAWRTPADPAHAPRGQEWHTDAGPHVPRAPGVPWPEAIPYPVFAICAHLYLAPCGPDDGPTAVLPGSHRSGLPPPREREWDEALEYEGRRPVAFHAEPGDVGLFVSDAWHRRLPPQESGKGRFFLQINYGRRELAQRVLPTAEVNHATAAAQARAQTERERLLIGLHPQRFYDG